MLEIFFFFFSWQTRQYFGHQIELSNFSLPNSIASNATFAGDGQQQQAYWKFNTNTDESKIKNATSSWHRKVQQHRKNIGLIEVLPPRAVSSLQHGIWVIGTFYNDSAVVVYYVGGRTSRTKISDASVYLSTYVLYKDEALKSAIDNVVIITTYLTYYIPM